MPFIIVLTIINLLGLIYLTFIVYKKIVSQAKPQKDISPETNSLTAGQIKSLTTAIQKVAILRFNPFDDLGGDQSFVLALLDDQSNGVVISSLHNRDNTRVYAKPVKNGQGDNITLSQEEKNAILKAING
jgi:hypothetical protein